MRRSRLIVSSFLVVSLVAGLMLGLPPVRVFAADGEPPELPVPTLPLPVDPPVVPQMPQSPPVAAAVWPAAGSAVVDLEGAGSSVSFVDGQVGVMGEVSPGGLPVWVTALGSASASAEEVEQRLSRGNPAGVTPLQLTAVSVSTFD